MISMEMWEMWLGIICCIGFGIFIGKDCKNCETKEGGQALRE